MSDRIETVHVDEVETLDTTNQMMNSPKGEAQRKYDLLKRPWKPPN
jgi:hypothetical protein